MVLSGFSSVTQSCLTLQPHGLQHARLPRPSASPRACSNSCPLSLWCHPAISSSAAPSSFVFSISQQASGSFPMGQLFTSGGQSTGASASATVLPTKILVDYWRLYKGIFGIVCMGRRVYVLAVGEATVKEYSKQFFSFNFFYSSGNSTQVIYWSTFYLWGPWICEDVSLKPIVFLM